MCLDIQSLKCMCMGRGELQQMEDVALAMGSPAAQRLRVNSKLVNHGLSLSV